MLDPGSLSFFPRPHQCIDTIDFAQFREKLGPPFGSKLETILMHTFLCSNTAQFLPSKMCCWLHLLDFSKMRVLSTFHYNLP